MALVLPAQPIAADIVRQAFTRLQQTVVQQAASIAQVVGQTPDLAEQLGPDAAEFDAKWPVVQRFLADLGARVPASVTTFASLSEAATQIADKKRGEEVVPEA